MSKEFWDGYQTLKKEYESNSPNAINTLTKLKIELIKGNFLTANANMNENEKLATRDIFELGVLIMVNQKDDAGFTRSFNQLQSFYRDNSNLEPSERINKMNGLNLMNLMAQNRIADFHLALESLNPAELENDPFLSFPVNLEKALMEGSYNKVLSAREQVPSPEFGYFMDLLAKTIRDEIASCCEKAYLNLPVQQLCTMLFLNKNDEVMSLAKERGWSLNVDQTVQFQTRDNDKAPKDPLPIHKIMEQTMEYAKELERIV